MDAWFETHRQQDESPDPESMSIDLFLELWTGWVAPSRTRQQLFSQTVGEVTIRGWNDGTFDVVDDWMLPSAAQFDTFEAAHTWAENFNSMEA